MECNKDEAVRAKEIAENKMKNNDFEGARKIALKAKKLYPELENITQLLSICDVHCSAQIGLLGPEKDWYGILQVEKLADELTVKKQYRRLALILHPDKNRFSGAEGAFKLICEANAVLSDPTKKALYDTKIKVSQFKKQDGLKKASNGSSGVNRTQTTRPNASGRKDTFWTCCQYCSMRYMYQRDCLNRSLRCQNCARQFIGYEIGAQNVPSKPDSSKEKVPPNQGKSKMGVKIEKEPSATQARSTFEKVPPHQGNSNLGINIEKEPSATQAGNASEVSGDFKSKEENNINANANSSHGAESRERNKSRKRARKEVDGSSESCDISSDSDLEDVTGMGSATDLNSDRAHFVRRSSRKRHDVSYNEKYDEDDFANPPDTSQASKLPDDQGQKSDLGSENLQNCNQNNVPADTVEPKSDINADCENSDKDVFIIPDPEFSDFDKDRDEGNFDVNQFWACYDTLDGMPRFYAKVKKVRSSPFEISFTWLEAYPIHETYEDWVNEELPVGCGSFKMGTNEKAPSTFTFSHRVHCEKGKKRGSLVIYPRQGEIWAVFKEWDISWSNNPESHKDKFKYEIVEIISDFVAGEGIKVCCLDKVGGFLCLFQRCSENENNSFVIGPNEVYKFSHFVPCSKMSGCEREGVPVGSFELDPAALPMNPDYLCYPSKTKMESVNMNGGDHSVETKPDIKKEGDNGDMSNVRRSPRVMNGNKQSAY